MVKAQYSNKHNLQSRRIWEAPLNQSFKYSNPHSWNWIKSCKDVCVKKGAALSTDQHLLVCNFNLEKPPGPTQTCRTTRSNLMRGPGRQKCMKGLCTLHIVNVPRDARKHSGDGVSGVALSVARICQQKWLSAWQILARKNKLGGTRWRHYSSKENSVPRMASEQCLTV